MIRRDEQGNALPTGMYWKHGAYWLVKNRRWRRLGTQYRGALIVYGRLTAPSSGAMAALVAEAMPTLTHGKAATTVRQYEAAGAQVAHLLADFEPGQVTQADIYDLLDQFRETPNMGNRVLTVARLVFRYAVKRRMIPNNPCVGVDRMPERKRDRYLTDAELAAIRGHAGDRLQVIIDLLYLTGQRVQDVLDIKRTDLTDDGIAFQQRKTGVRRTVAWNAALRAAVKAAKALPGPANALLLLRGRWGGAVDYRSLHEQWARACRLAGVTDAHIHDIRAKSATDAKREGADPQALLGHASEAMTARYLRLRESPVVQGPKVRRLIDKRAK